MNRKTKKNGKKGGRRVAGLFGVAHHETVAEMMEDMAKDSAPGAVGETFESAGCDGQCPTYPGAPVTEDGYPDCSKCPQFQERKKKHG